MKLYYVLEMREEYASMSALYITSNKDKAIRWMDLNNDESHQYCIASKEQEHDDVFLKCDLFDDPRNNYFAGLYKKIQNMDEDEYSPYWETIIGKENEVKIFEL